MGETQPSRRCLHNCDPFLKGESMQATQILRGSSICAVLTCAFAIVSNVPANAQYYEDLESDGAYAYLQGGGGDSGRISLPTGQGNAATGREFAGPTATQMTAMVATVNGQLAPKFGPRGRNGLPAVSMDSFVKNAGAYAEQIYGDEGAEGLPQIEKFLPENRINFGIVGDRASGLTTGHGSVLPNAWGADDKTGGTEWSMSGPYPVELQQRIQIPDVRQSVDDVVDFTRPALDWDLGK